MTNPAFSPPAMFVACSFVFHHTYLVQNSGNDREEKSLMQSTPTHCLLFPQDALSYFSPQCPPKQSNILLNVNVKTLPKVNRFIAQQLQDPKARPFELSDSVAAACSQRCTAILTAVLHHFCHLPQTCQLHQYPPTYITSPALSIRWPGSHLITLTYSVFACTGCTGSCR